jgi:hypothetical protein
MLNWSSMEPTHRDAIRQALRHLGVEVQQSIFCVLHFNRPGGVTGCIPSGVVEAALAKKGFTITDPKVHANGSVSGVLVAKT